MSVVAKAPYAFPARDIAAHFPEPLLYIGWDHHMMFCAPLAVPVPPTTKFGELVDTLLPRLYGEHPDFRLIDWDRVQWFRSSGLFTPDYSRAIGQQGFRHKSVLRFRTPGLQGLQGSFG